MARMDKSLSFSISDNSTLQMCTFFTLFSTGQRLPWGKNGLKTAGWGGGGNQQ